MKLISMLFVVVLILGFSASVARADGVDPIVRISGNCTSSSCDAFLIGPGQTTVNFSETITCTSATDPTSCTANATIINDSGTDLTNFDVMLSAPNLTFTCQSTFTYVCMPLGGGLFAITLGPGSTSFCSTDSNDIGGGGSGPNSYFLIPDSTPDADDLCSTIQIGLTGSTTEMVQDLSGAMVSGTLTAPEPSSALLLFFGFMAGLAVFKFSRTALA